MLKISNHHSNTDSNGIESVGLRELTKSCWDKLEECDLDWNNIGEEGVQYLGHWKNLTKLSFRLWQIGERGAKSLV